MDLRKWAPADPNDTVKDIHKAQERDLMLPPLFCLRCSGIMVASRNVDANFQGFFYTGILPPANFTFLILNL